MNERRVVGYIRVSTEEQADSGAGLGAQRTMIMHECERRGWTLLGIREDAGLSGKSLAGRVALQSALEDLDAGRATALVVAKLDRLSRSLLDFAGLMERARQRHWSLVALDIGVDTTTPNGQLIANVMASFAQFERELIGQRTREALAEKRRRGVRLGRPPTVSEAIRSRIRAMRQGGGTLRAIASELNQEGVSGAHGGRWYATTIRRLVCEEEAHQS